MGVASWGILGDSPVHAMIHLRVLQCLREASENREILRTEIVPVKRISLLIQHVEAAIDDLEMGSEKLQECLDRLGQFLHAVTAAKCLSGTSGKASAEVISCLKRLPANRLIEAFVVNLAKG